MAFNMKKPENSIAELEREEAKRAEEEAVAKAAHDEKVAEDTRSANALTEASLKRKKAEADLADAHAEAKRREFARMVDPLVETLVASRKTVVAANAKALAAALP
jgi:hypothetical protein